VRKMERLAERSDNGRARLRIAGRKQR
jgi:hypothetical protein